MLQILGKPVFIVVRINVAEQTQLAEIAHTLCSFASLLGSAQGRKKHARQDGNHCDHDQKLNQREPARLSLVTLHAITD
jgi:hypothetical protein